MSEGKLPTFLIIGAMKAGTSSLHYYLRNHPDIFMSETKELDYFMVSKNYNRGLEWYKSQFVTDKKVRGESSPNYSKYEITPKLIFESLPEIKLIYILRDPVNRFKSHMQHLNINPNSYLKNINTFEPLETGLYYKHIQNYSQYFSRQQILILNFDRLKNDKINLFKEVFNFLEVDHQKFDYSLLNTIKHETSSKLNPTATVLKLNKLGIYKSLKKIIRPNSFGFNKLKSFYKNLAYKKHERVELNQESIKFLEEFYKQDVTALRSKFGLSLKEWSI
jgi:hypothetical protein